MFDDDDDHNTGTSADFSALAILCTSRSVAFSSGMASGSQSRALSAKALDDSNRPETVPDKRQPLDSESSSLPKGGSPPKPQESGSLAATTSASGIRELAVVKEDETLPDFPDDFELPLDSESSPPPPPHTAEPLDSGRLPSPPPNQPSAQMYTTDGSPKVEPIIWNVEYLKAYSCGLVPVTLQQQGKTFPTDGEKLSINKAIANCEDFQGRRSQLLGRNDTHWVLLISNMIRQISQNLYDRSLAIGPVSYTHLTLPTKRIV